MSTAEGWYDDPSSPGRLRYWDGSDWTEWINENGETRSQPLPPPPGGSSQDVVDRSTAAPTGRPTETGAAIPPAGGYAPSPDLQPAPAWGQDPAPETAPQEMTPSQRMGYMGLAAGGVLALASTGQEMTRPKEMGPIPRGYDVGGGAFLLGIPLLAAAALALFVKKRAARVVALIVATLVLFFQLAVLLGARSGDQFFDGEAIVIKPGWWILLVSVVVGMVGLAIAMWGSIAKRRTGRVLPIIAMVIVFLILGFMLIFSLITDPTSSWVEPK